MGTCFGKATSRSHRQACFAISRVFALVYVTALFSELAAAQEGDREVAQYKLIRYEEDWSRLRDPVRRTDLFDSLKYIALGRHEGWYLTVGGETRQRYEYFRNPTWGLDPQDDNGYLLQRYMIHADLHLGQRLRLFGQLKRGIENGRPGGPRPPDEDRLDIHQAFVETQLWVAGNGQRLGIR